MPVDILDLQARIARLEQQMAGVPNQPVTVYDGGGIPRVQIGNLAAYTDPRGYVSSAGYALRALDANGNLIFDSSGTLGAQQLAEGPVTGSSSLVAGTGQVVPGTSKTFSVTSANGKAVLMMLAFVGAKFTAGSGVANIYCQITGPAGAVTGTAAFVDAALAGYQNAAPHMTFVGAASGSYTSRLLADVPNGATVTFLAGNTHTFQFGA